MLNYTRRPVTRSSWSEVSFWEHPRPCGILVGASPAGPTSSGQPDVENTEVDSTGGGA
jgi:hypothetical protein